MGKIEKVLLIQAVLAAIALGVPDLGVIAAITIIGLPIAIAYWAMPAIFLFSLLAYLIYRVLPLPRAPAVGVSLVLSAAALALPAYLLNTAIHRQAASLAEGDKNTLTLPLKAATIANRGTFRFDKDASKCDGFCLHALLTGAAKRFLVAHTKTPQDDLSAKQKAVAFQLERRPVCPAVKFKQGRHKLAFPRVKGDRSRAADPVEAMKLRISNGECLISNPATLGEADIVITRGKVIPGIYRHQKPGFSLSQNTNFANRISVHQVKAGSAFEEIFRQTQVRYRPFGWFMLPAPDSRGSFNVGFGWWRSEAKINIKHKYQRSSEWTEFLTETLELKLKLAGEDTKKKTLDKLRKLLDEETPPTAADWALFSQYFSGLGFGRTSRMDATDFELGVRMLNNKDYPAPARLLGFVKYAERNQREPELSRLAGIFVNRLSEDASRSEALGAKPARQIRRLALGLKALPAPTLLQHKDAMMALALRPEVQQHGYQALQRLAVFGDDAVPTLLSLMKVGLDGGKHFYRKSRFQHPYLGGLRGLCQAGGAAPTALPALRQMALNGELPDHASYGRLLFTTLLRLGEDKTQVRSLFNAAARNPSHATDEKFDRLVSRALGKKQKCYF